MVIYQKKIENYAFLLKKSEILVIFAKFSLSGGIERSFCFTKMLLIGHLVIGSTRACLRTIFYIFKYTFKTDKQIDHEVSVDGTGDDAVLVDAPSGEEDGDIWCLKFDQLKAILFDESSIYNFFQKQTDITAESDRILRSLKTGSTGNELKK